MPAGASTMMEDAASFPPVVSGEADSPEQRAAPRMALLIRTAKLVSAQGEFVCVLRDVSATGISVRLFHRLPSCDAFTLELQSGMAFEVKKVRENDNEAGFQFAAPVELETIIKETGRFPKRGLRMHICFPVVLATRQDRKTGTILNLSQQGARLESDALLSIDQTIALEGPDLGEIRAKVRWRKEREYGLVFDDTFSLQNFACLAARLQCPALLRS